MNNLARALNYAHLEALERGQRVRVLPGMSELGWAGELNVLADDDSLLRKVPAMSRGARVVAPGLAAVDFDALGGLAQSGSMAVISYELGAINRSLVVCINGRVVQGRTC
ncbi:Type II transport protein GspH [compost metagenome]